MPRKIQTAQRPYTLLVANLKGGSDPSKGVAGNPVKARTGFTYQHFPEVSRQGVDDRAFGVERAGTPGVGTLVGHVDYTVANVPVASSADITVADNDFTYPARLFVGSFELISGEDFAVGGTTDVTATNLTAAINLLDGFSATVLGSVVTVSGPPGPGGNDTLLEAIFEGAVANFTLDPADGSFAGGEPTVGPLVILP